MIDFDVTASGDIVFEESARLGAMRLNMSSAKALLILKHSTSHQPYSMKNDGLKLTISTNEKASAFDCVSTKDNDTIAQMIEWDCKIETNELPHTAAVGSDVYQAFHKEHNNEMLMEALRSTITTVAERYIDEPITVTVDSVKNDLEAFRFNRYHVTINSDGFYHEFEA